MSIFAILVLGIYTFALFYITIYCLMQFNLLYHYKKHQNRTHTKAPQAVASKPELALAGTEGDSFHVSGIKGSDNFCS